MELDRDAADGADLRFHRESLPFATLGCGMQQAKVAKPVVFLRRQDQLNEPLQRQHSHLHFCMLAISL